MLSSQTDLSLSLKLCHLFGCVTLEKLVFPSNLQFPLLENGDYHKDSMNKMRNKSDTKIHNKWQSLLWICFFFKVTLCWLIKFS